MVRPWTGLAAKEAPKVIAGVASVVIGGELLGDVLRAHDRGWAQRGGAAGDALLPVLTLAMKGKGAPSAIDAVLRVQRLRTTRTHVRGAYELGLGLDLGGREAGYALEVVNPAASREGAFDSGGFAQRVTMETLVRVCGALGAGVVTLWLRLQPQTSEMETPVARARTEHLESPQDEKRSNKGRVRERKMPQGGERESYRWNC